MIMKKSLLPLFLCMAILLVVNVARSQDYVYLIDSDTIKSKVLEVNEDNVKYKDFENLDGPIYTINITRVDKIVYQNGKVDTFVFTNTDHYSNENYNQNSNNGIVNPDLPKVISYDELMIMNDNEKEVYLSTLGVSSIYERFLSGNMMANKGRNLRFTGIGLSIGGLVLYTSGAVISGDMEEEGILLAVLGSTVLTVGQVITIVSIPISIVGGVKKASAENMYREFYLGKPFSYIQPKLNFGLTQNGVGLTLKF